MKENTKKMVSATATPLVSILGSADGATVCNAIWLPATYPLAFNLTMESTMPPGGAVGAPGNSLDGDVWHGLFSEYQLQGSDRSGTTRRGIWRKAVTAAGKRNTRAGQHRFLKWRISK